MAKILIIAGTWILADAIYSINVYINSPSYEGSRQSFRRDHWVRVVRGILAIIIIVIGVLYE